MTEYWPLIVCSRSPRLTSQVTTSCRDTNDNTLSLRLRFGQCILTVFFLNIIAADSENETVRYLITVATGNLKGAGTNGSVSLVIKGTKQKNELLF